MGRRNKPTGPGLLQETSLNKETDLKDITLNKETDSSVKNENECFLCGAPDATLCKACGVVAACPLHTSHHQVAIFDYFFIFVNIFIFVQFHLHPDFGRSQV